MGYDEIILAIKSDIRFIDKFFKNIDDNSDLDKFECVITDLIAKARELFILTDYF
jgi:hypothetical protein